MKKCMYCDGNIYKTQNSNNWSRRKFCNQLCKSRYYRKKNNETEDGRKKLIKRKKEWMRNFKDKVKEYKKTPSARFYNNKSRAKNRGYEWGLTKNDFISIINKECYYCGYNESNVGVDRVNNDMGYIINNCVPCCTNCNLMKRAQSKKDFINQCVKITKHSQHKT